MKKRVTAVLLLVVMLISLTACKGKNSENNNAADNANTGANKTSDSASKSESKDSEGKKLTVWLEKVFSDEANAALQERVEEFKKETGIDVKYELLAATDFVPKLNAAIEAGTNVPDVTLTSGAITKVLNYYPNIPNVDVTDLVNKIHGIRPYFESIIEGSKIDGVNYFVPFYSSSTLMFIRKDKLEEKGITTLPSTWEEVFEAAEAVSDPANGFYGLGIGCGPTDEDCENTFRMILWNDGGYIFNEDGSVAINNEKAINLINKYVDMYDKEIIPPAATTWDPGGNNSSYLMGESAIVFNAPTLYNALQGDEAYKEIFENTVAMAPPAGTDNSVAMGFISGFAIMNTCKDQETAGEFIKYMLDAKWYDSYFKITAPVFAPLFQDAENDEFWADGINKQVVNYAKNASGYYGYPVSSIEGRVAAAKHYFTYPVAQLLNSVVTGASSVDEAIAKMEADIAAITEEIK